MQCHPSIHSGTFIVHGGGVVWKHLEWPLVAELFRFRHGRDRFGFARSTVQLLIRTRTFYTMNQSDRRNHAVELVSNSIVATHKPTYHCSHGGKVPSP